MKFKELRFKNFLSFGNKWTTINLDSNKSTIVIGKNGRGKSVFLDAFHYVLTGKPFRKIKIPQIPNSINKKNCLVELDIEHNGSNFLIRRGIKPNIFEIIKDNVLLNENSHNADFQSVLENICNFNPKNLKNTTIMSSMEYKPFLEMTAGDKRIFLDDFLDIEIFTHISKHLKQQLTIVKDNCNDVENSISSLKSNLSIIREMNEKAKINNDDEIAELQSSLLEEKDRSEQQCREEVHSFKLQNKKNIDIIKNSKKEDIISFEKKKLQTIKELRTKITDIENTIDYLETSRTNNYKTDNDLHAILVNLENKNKKRQTTLEEKNTDAENRSNELNSNVNQINQQIAILQSNLRQEIDQLEFVNDNTICPKCKRDIDESFKIEATTDIQQKIDEYNNELSKLKNELIKWDEFDKKLKTFKSKINSLKKAIEISNKEVNDIVRKRDKLLHERHRINDDIDDKNKQLDSIYDKLDNIEETNKQEIEDLIERYDSKITRLIDSEDEQSKNIISNFKNRYLQTKQRIEEKIDRLSRTEKIELKDENEILNKLIDEEGKLKGIEYDKLIHELAINLASDKVIKAYIINKYIPILNQFINEYLDILEAPYRLKFDESLNEQIVARGYEKLSYGSFSSGERARCDLAILLAFLELSKLKTASGFNVIMLDEVADNSLDKEGISGILSIISRLKTKGYTVFVVSHRDEMKNEFDVTMTATKDVFSNLKEL